MAKGKTHQVTHSGQHISESSSPQSPSASKIDSGPANDCGEAQTDLTSGLDRYNNGHAFQSLEALREPQSLTVAWVRFWPANGLTAKAKCRNAINATRKDTVVPMTIHGNFKMDVQ